MIDNDDPRSGATSTIEVTTENDTENDSKSVTEKQKKNVTFEEQD